MPFDLFVTSTAGETRKSLRSPYAAREDMEHTVYMVLCGIPVPAGTFESFVEQVLTAPLSETVVHGPTGIAFRTEEIR